ncbi:MAG TPA: hypothetical protein VLK57_21145 [Pseudonocardia sp.]|nr:hypothetical protein [Pseudonocardia sp.]
MHRTSALRRRVAEVAPVGGGLFVLGVSAYVVLGAAGHTLAPGDYAAVASLYLLVAITSPGVFTALEQETNREVSSRRALGLGTGAVGRAGLVVGAGYAGVVAAVLLAAAPLLVPRVLGGSWGLLAAAIVAAAGAAAVYLLRVCSPASSGSAGTRPVSGWRAPSGSSRASCWRSSARPTRWPTAGRSRSARGSPPCSACPAGDRRRRRAHPARRSTCGGWPTGRVCSPSRRGSRTSSPTPPRWC